MTTLEESIARLRADLENAEYTGDDLVPVRDDDLARVLAVAEAYVQGQVLAFALNPRDPTTGKPFRIRVVPEIAE